ncbi:MAG: PIN domain-containing protein [Polyangiaceae bacterium]|nr:PIN domain-containing protein [Polyangiaceae bacterium]MCW5790087.1 PIN domain-containing protein [Polyangiaceae bacterium]
MLPGPVLLDTDTLSEISRGHPGAVARARAYLGQFGKLTISSVTVFERRRGYCAALRAGKPYHEQSRAFEALVNDSLVIPFDESAAGFAATIWAAASRAQRQGLGDILIAATALAQQLPLVTRNRRDFNGLMKVSGLTLPLVDWTSKSASRG